MLLTVYVFYGKRSVAQELFLCLGSCGVVQIIYYGIHPFMMYICVSFFYGKSHEKLAFLKQICFSKMVVIDFGKASLKLEAFAEETFATVK